jgi:16S rRNA (cytosine967-C5)-methyltransferase
MTSQKKTGLKPGPEKAAPKNRPAEISKARKAAFAVLMAVERGQAHSDDLLRGKAVNALSPADRNLATTLVLGVLRWQIRLDHQIQGLLARPNAKLDAEILIALRLGAFQLLHMDRIPARAAIDESVELAKQAGHRFASGMVNAVLRKLGKASQFEIERPALKGHDFSRAAQGATSSQDLAPEGSLSEDMEAHPAWMVERWINLYGLETAQTICRHGQSQPELTVRLAQSPAEKPRPVEDRGFPPFPQRDAERMGHPDVEAEFVEAGIVLEAGELLTAARTVVAGDVTATAAFRDGRLRFQDEGSQLVAELAGWESDNLNEEARTIGDFCAAPGGKTLILAERNPQARIVAYESSAPRLRQLQDRLAHLGARVECRQGDATALTEDAVFDIVLADVPCSGTGTLGRNPEIRHRQRPEDLGRQAARQRAILSAALRAVRPGGRVFYSTCSLEPEENELVVAAVLAATPNVRLVSLDVRVGELLAEEILTPSGAARLRGALTPEGSLRLLPGVFQTDGFFIAMIERGENQA